MKRLKKIDCLKYDANGFTAGGYIRTNCLYKLSDRESLTLNFRVKNNRITNLLQNI